MHDDNVKRLVEDYFNGQYEIRKFLGEGSFSKVYLVKHKFLDDLRAMKIIKEPLKSTANTKNVFREVKLATQLRHRNIISIYDAGIISDNDDLAYFVMEYVPGGDLEQYLNSFINSNMSMPVGSVLNLMKQILEGLDVLHSSNPPIVHRDLKLNNILLNYNACGDIVIKISDFGFAKEVTTGISDIDIVGTRPYMAPECFNKTVSTMTDIYAIGVIFYLLLTARYPYDVDRFSIQDLLDLKPWNAPLIKPSQYDDRISEKLDDIVMKCLQINPQNRYQNAGELLDDIEWLIDEVNSSHDAGEMAIGMEYTDDFSDYIINDSLNGAFRLAKQENKLNEAIEILEKEVLKDYEIRKYYGETLRMWKSKRPDVKLVSKAFTVNLKAKNYNLSCDLLREAIAYNPSIMNRYQHYFKLWDIFTELSRDKNLIKAVIGLDELIQIDKSIFKIYGSIINVLKTYSVDEIVSEAVRLVSANNLADGANLMEFAVVQDNNIRKEYEYRLSLWKQNMDLHYGTKNSSEEDTIDYAIDLGTNDSVISYYNDGNPTIIRNHATGDVFTPSAVLIDDEGTIQVGKTAREAVINNEGNAISEFKHDMGFPVPFKSGNSSRILFPEELSAEVLKDLRLSVYRQCNFNMEHAVICVPANSNPMKTKAIMDAAELAGFRSYNLIFEPIAAAIAYDLKASEDERGLWMIYDLGGGTFNVSLVRDNEGVIEKLATDGLDNFGGNALDWKLVEDVLAPKVISDLRLNDFRRSNSKYKNIFLVLKNAAEKAKIDLSESDKTEIFIPELFEGYDFCYVLDKGTYKEMIKPLIKSSFDLCYGLLNRNSLPLDEIDKVILVGGSSKSPIVQELIFEEFGLPLEHSIDPLTAVAKGAAIYAGSLKKPDETPEIGNVSVILNIENSKLEGRLFSLDDKLSFMGFYLEFVNEKGFREKIPADIDGKFNVNLDDGEYDINVYFKEKLIVSDEKSPSKLKNNMMFIPFLNEFYDVDCELDFDELADEYADFIRSIENLSVYSEFENDVYEYLNRLVEISQLDLSASNQVKIYLDYLKGIADSCRRDLEFSNLLGNVEKKLNISGKSLDLDTIIKNKNYEELKKIHYGLVEEYVSSNRNDVLKECFFNLRAYGIFTRNRMKSQKLIEEALAALNNQNYNGLFDIVNELYEIDERR